MIQAAFYDWLPVLSLVSAGCVGLPRAWVMWRQGVRVIAAERHRSCGQTVFDTGLLAGLAMWGCCVFARIRVTGLSALPDWLAAELVGDAASRLCGAALAILWVVIYALGVRALGDAWRLGIDRERPGPLVTRGILRWTRNPIYLAFDLHFLSTFLWDGRVVFLLLGLLLALMLHGVILREEKFLESSFGEEFRAYKSQVGRYLSFPGNHFPLMPAV